ncbi:MAG: DEAD/DEAH box helicase family protein [Chloroflexi bacterium]|nr:DEAD/DEAH box helicase family protein [Chloroflexota bacterium]
MTRFRLRTTSRGGTSRGAPPTEQTPAGPDEIDAWRLAGMLVPGLGRGERAKLGQALGLTLPLHEPASPAAVQAERTAIVDACRTRLAALDLSVLQQLARIFAGSRILEAQLIEEVFRARAHSAFERDEAADASNLDAAEALAPVAPAGPALQPSKLRQAVDQGHVLRALSPGGAIARSLTGYEARPGQVKMARAVAKALSEQLHLVVEAGTGTGKSIAYLVPAAEYAVANGRRVVISTNTINLQEQLFFKDVPLVQRALGVPFRATALKGRANYLCLRRWRGFLREGLTSDADRIFAAKVLLWLRQTETGDRNELALDEYESARWATQLAADALHCTHPLCRDHRAGRCFLARARRRAEAAHLLIVNHALLLADQALESKVLPEYADLIVDEAHHLEDAATEQLSVAIDQQELAFFLAAVSQQQGPGRYAGLISRILTVLMTQGGPPLRSQAPELTQPANDAIDEARRLLHDFFVAVTTFVRGAGDGPLFGERDIRLTAAQRGTEWWSAVEEAWQPFDAALGRTDRALARLSEVLDDLQGTSDLVDEALADLAGVQRQVAEVRTNLGAIVARPSDETVCWVAANDRGIALRSAPLEVGPLLEQQLFSQKESVILTSATIQVGGSFRHIRQRLGLGDGAYTLAVPSPFDYSSQALLCVPDNLPEPSSLRFGDASLEALEAICRATRGRTLVLFTSHASLRAAHTHLQKRLRGVTVLGQGIDGPRQHLLQRFRESPDCILLGTSSFWEGIDVVGDALSCLVIVKLPFSVPSDPVFAARSELFEAPFFEYAVPQAVLRLKQGFGRLIRSRTDRGVVVILDSRLWTKSYGQTFLRSLPPASRRRCASGDLAQIVQTWLRE